MNLSISNEFLTLYGLLQMKAIFSKEEKDTIYLYNLNNNIIGWFIQYFLKNKIKFTFESLSENEEEEDNYRLVIDYDSFKPIEKHLIFWLNINKHNTIHPIINNLTKSQFRYLFTGWIYAFYNEINKKTNLIYFYLNHLTSITFNNIIYLLKKFNIKINKLDLTGFSLELQNISLDNKML
jgi:hypothetical protein